MVILPGSSQHALESIQRLRAAPQAYHRTAHSALLHVTPLAQKGGIRVMPRSYPWSFTRRRRFLVSFSARNGLPPFALIGSLHRLHATMNFCSVVIMLRMDICQSTSYFHSDSLHSDCPHNPIPHQSSSSYFYVPRRRSAEFLHPPHQVSKMQVIDARNSVHSVTSFFVVPLHRTRQV